MKTEFLLNYIEGNCTEEGKVAIVNWLDSNPDNMREFLALRKLHDITIWQQSADAALEQKPVNISIWKRRSFYTEIIKIAAVLLIAIFVSRYFLSDFKAEKTVAMQTMYAPAGQRAEITLEDGTKVWLNAKSTLTFPNQFTGKTREVKLDGEGFFDVTPNKARPFIVKTNKYDVKVWGTKFNLMAYRGKGIFETSLLEGSVEVMQTGQLKGIVIKPAERVFEADNRLVKADILYPNHFLWKEGIISFNDESFTDMVSKLELYFDLKIIVKNDKISNYRCTGKFRTKDGVEHILKVLKLSNKFNFSIDDKQNIITIN